MFEMGAKFDAGWNLEKEEKAGVQKEIKIPKDHRLHFAKEKRNGKTITIVKPFFLEKQALETLLKTLKKKLSVGGTLKEDHLEFQGELHEKLKSELTTLGFGLKKP